MARGINRVILIGNLGGDPEVRYMPNGNAVTNLTLATSDSWKDKQSGQIQERTEWHRVSLFGKIAEIAGQYLVKGSKVYIEGRLQTREWEKDGIKRYTTEVIVDMGGTMQMLDGRGDGQGTRPAQSQQNNQQKRPPPQADPHAGSQSSAQPEYDSFDDDIPFANPYRGRRCLLI